MTKPIDQSAFIEIFTAEAEESLAKLTQGLLSVEKNPNQPEVIEELFRVAHTLKGCARMMGYADIEQVAHRLEDVFGKIQQGELTVSTKVADEALAAVDAMSASVAAIAEGKVALPASSPVAKIVESYVVKDEIARKPSELSAPQKSLQSGNPAASRPDVTLAKVARHEEFIRIPISRVNTLFNLAGELVIHKVRSSHKLGNLRRLRQQAKTSHKRLTQLIEQAQQGNADQTELVHALHQYHSDVDRLKLEIGELAELLSAEALHLDPVIDELQYKVKELRMLPCATIFDGLERLVRDIAHQEKKSVDLMVEGEDTELDKKVLEAMKPCLVHLLRNAVDHGIELPNVRVAEDKPRAGTIWLRASQQGGKAIIEVRDDGRGIDLERVKQVAIKQSIATEQELAQMDERELMNLIFAPGFSTSPIITDVSGRGVGMDVVRKEVEALKGQIRVDSQLGQGTAVTIELPLTVAIMEVLLVEAEEQRLGLPMLAIEEIVRVKPADVQTVNQRMAINLRERTVPVVKLGEILGLPTRDQTHGVEHSEWPVVIASLSERRIGLLVDNVLSEEEVFIKSLGNHLGTLKNVSGAAILGTGEVVMILDVQDLIVSARHTRGAVPSMRTSEAPASKPKVRILIAEDSLTTREFERNLLEAQGYEVETAIDGLDALEKLGNGKFDLVVSDVQMPRVDGFEFCRRLRERPEFKELPFIFVTTLDKDEEKRRGIEVGAQAYIVKGAFDQSNLLQTIERLTG